jgi:uncharacterized protein
LTDTEKTGGDAAAGMKSLLRRDLGKAMKAGRRSEAALLRALIAAIDNAEAVAPSSDGQPGYRNEFHEGTAEVPRRQLSRAEVRAVLEAEIASRAEASEAFERFGRGQDAATMRADLRAARRYLGA